MPEKGALVVQVVDADQAPVRDATLSLQRQGVVIPAALTWHERLLGYQFDVEPAVYQVTVDAPGFLTETIEADAQVFPRTERVMLGREGQSYYFENGRRVYFHRPTPPPGAAAFAPMESESTDLGPIVGWAGNEPIFLTRYLYIETEEAITLDALRELLADFPVDVEMRDSLRSNVYLVRLRDDPSDQPELLQERLKGISGIRSVSAVLHAENNTTGTGVEPDDLLFPLQWSYRVMRVPEAWAELDPNCAPASFGSPFVLVAVHDTGLRTAAGVVQHPQLSGKVSTPGGTEIKKVALIYDLLSNPMVPHNDNVTDTHGVRVAGIVSASTGTEGTVGIAANTRLAAYRFSQVELRWTHGFLHAAGFAPRWTEGAAGYIAQQQFPYMMGGGASPLPVASIINCSHTAKIISSDLPKALSHLSKFGRFRHGVLFFVTSGNLDEASRKTSRWGEDLNVMKVAASSIDHRGAEVRMPDSSWTTSDTPDIDFAAPSRNHLSLILKRYQPPNLRAVATLTNVGAGDVPGTLGQQIAIIGPIAKGDPAVAVSAADHAAFTVPTPVLIRDKNDKRNSEVRRATAKLTAGNKISLNEPLTLPHAAAELITGAIDYTAIFGGTSAAAPHVAAVAALMISLRPELTWLEVRDMLRTAAVPIDLKATGIGGRTRWVNIVANGDVTNLIDPNGLLALSGPRSKLSVAAEVGERTIHLAHAGVQGNLKPRQALLIGAETVLQNVAAFEAEELDVASVAGFEAGKRVFVGRRCETVIVDPAATGASVVIVANVDGFQANDTISIDSESVVIDSIGSHGDGDVNADVKLKLMTPLVAPHLPGALVTLAPAFLEGPLLLASASGHTLKFDGVKLQFTHPAGTIVQKEKTEVRAVVSTGGIGIEIDPLLYQHDPGEPVSVGLVASYSYGYGYGRIDALAAVKAAKTYTYDRDLVIRNFLADDGWNSRNHQPVHSPDLWITNSLPTPTKLVYETDAGPHQNPQVTVDPAIFIGGGKNDLEVSGSCGSAAERTFTIEIESLGTPDKFKWHRDGGQAITGVEIGVSAQPLSDGVFIRFAATGGHTAGDKWIVKAREVDDRYFHLRVHNRGSKKMFERSLLPNAVPVTSARMLLCASDGSPVCRFHGKGKNDLQIRGTYTGADDARYTVETLSTSTFQWFRNSVQTGPVTITPGLPQVLDFGVSVVFGSATEHLAADRWEIRASPMPKGFLNIHHYWDTDEPMPFQLATGEAGTRILSEPEIPALGGSEDPDPEHRTHLLVAEWGESQRPPTNSPNDSKPTRSMRLFALGEVVPHDGPLAGFTAESNNNISFRELVFAKFRFSKNSGADPAEGHLDVDEVGTAKTKSIRVEVRMTAGTFETERVRVKVTAKKRTGPDEVRYFRYANGWGWDIATPWATVHPPVEARRPDGTEVPATGEQFDIHFDLDFTVDRTFTDLVIEPEILSAFREFAVASEAHTISIYSVAPKPGGAGQAAVAAQPKPASFVFADVASLTQSASQAFGPVDGSPTTQYRTTALFQAPSDVQAYAVTDGVVAVQRQTGSNVAVNLILRPCTQPVAGFPPVRYFIYRGLRLDAFLAGISANDEKLVRAQTGASPFMAEVWTDFKNLNPSATTVPPSTFIGYDPAAPDSDPLQNLFFRLDVEKQLPYVTKGKPLGLFHAAASFDFGFEIVLEDNAYSPDLAFARRAANVIDIGAMQTDDLARRLKKEEILAFLDPAAFYGLHMHEGGRVDVPIGPSLDGEGIFTSVVSHFKTQNRLYLDVRSEHGRSLNFHRNYDDGSGNQIQTGTAAASVTPKPYASNGWPIVLIDSVAAADPNADHNELYVSLRRNDNVDPVLFVEHGRRLAGGGAFLRAAELGTDPWTAAIGFRFPNLSTSRVNMAWPLRLYYGRRAPQAAPPPPKPEVVPTQSYTDNIFGSIDQSGGWATPAATADPVIKWAAVQPNHYVDAQGTQGWRQMMRTGIAQQSGPTPRSLLYAMATAPDFEDPEFVPVRGEPDGVSSEASFFRERGLFGVYGLDQGVVVDASTPVRTLSLRQSADEGYPPTSAMLVGVTDAELTTLRDVGAATMTKDYDRTIILDDRNTVTNGGGSADRYRLGVRGLAVDGTHTSEFPGTPIHVYSVDGRLFASAGFAAAEPPPGPYTRNYEEAKGAATRPVRTRNLASVDVANHSITIANDDWRSEIVAGNTLLITASATNDGIYTAGSVTFDGTNTVIVLIGSPVLSPVLQTVTPLGSAFTVERNVEDVFIDRDYRATNPNGIPKLRTLVDGFISAIGLVAASDANAKSLLQSIVDSAAGKILNRARWLASDDRSSADEAARSLYFARLRMTVALKSHDFCRTPSADPAQDRTPLLEALEAKSRGYDLDFLSAPKDAIRVLVTGFDSFTRNPDELYLFNPSGAVALALHGKPISGSGKPASVESAVFPVRYADFDAGRVEALAGKWLMGQTQDAARAAMIVTVSLDDTIDVYEVERLAGRLRGSTPDNNTAARTVPPKQIGDSDATWAAFYESKLPIDKMVPGPFLTPPDPSQKVFFDQSYESSDPTASQNTPHAKKDPGVNDNKKNPAATPAGKAVKGSGNNLLSNEIFYRVARERNTRKSVTLTGHIHIPFAQAVPKGITAVIDQVEELIRRALAGL